MTKEMDYFQYHLEDNLWRLHVDLIENNYRHGGYRHFTIKESKRRDIAVASIRDRVCHRLAYEYLVAEFDRTFIYDAWSCRKDKGVVGAIERTQIKLKEYPRSWVWRADISKFFDNVDQRKLLHIIFRKIIDKNAIRLVENIIRSYSIGNSKQSVRCGIPIGNLTSQVFANIYLNEFDRHVKHDLKPQFYLRYGDDFIIITESKEETALMREKAVTFLLDVLSLQINRKNDIIVPVRRGLSFLGTVIYPTGRRLKKNIWKRAQERLNATNVSSYSGLVKQHFIKKVRDWDWHVRESISEKF